MTSYIPTYHDAGNNCYYSVYIFLGFFGFFEIVINYLYDHGYDCTKVVVIYTYVSGSVNMASCFLMMTLNYIYRNNVHNRFSRCLTNYVYILDVILPVINFGIMISYAYFAIPVNMECLSNSKEIWFIVFSNMLLVLIAYCYIMIVGAIYRCRLTRGNEELIRAYNRTYGSTSIDVSTGQSGDTSVSNPHSTSVSTSDSKNNTSEINLVTVPLNDI